MIDEGDVTRRRHTVVCQFKYQVPTMTAMKRPSRERVWLLEEPQTIVVLGLREIVSGSRLDSGNGTTQGGVGEG